MESTAQIGKVRLSLGSAIALGLRPGRIDVRPTTAYLLAASNAKCSANCAFCPQARKSKANVDMLSRITWPLYDLEDVAKAVAADRSIKRVCIQSVNYEGVMEDVLRIAQTIRAECDVDVSVSSHPLDRAELLALKNAGVGRVAVPLDAASPEVFRRIKGTEIGGSYTWTKHLQALDDTISVFGKGNVTTHLIVGLGETDRDLAAIMEQMVKLGVLPALFAFTPIPGTSMENVAPPPIGRYRRIQLIRHLIVEKGELPQYIQFDSRGGIGNLGIPNQQLDEIISSGKPFLTSGCPDCNRPYYNERVSGPIYNYSRPLTDDEIAEARRQISDESYEGQQ